MARSTFYYHLKALSRPDKYLAAREEISRIYYRNWGRYGYRRITLNLRANGIVLNHKTVALLMKQQGIRCMIREKKYQSYRGQPGKKVPNIMKRNFKANAPNQKLVTDVTQFSLFGKRLYLSPVMDLYNSEILGYTICERANMEMVTGMLEKVFKKLPKRTHAILHSDQGWLYQSPYYRKILKDKGLIQSMSRKGNCYDNAVMENFFGILKSELLYLHTFSSMKDFKRELILYIDYYNNERIKLKLNGLSPVKYRTQSVQVI
jgi:transposase InsO family protein